MTNGIPRIEIDALGPGAADPEAAREVGQALRRACEEVGFFSINDHGVPRAIIEGGVRAATRFFALPEASKRACAPRHWNPQSPNVYRGYFPSQVAGKQGFDLGEPALRDEDLGAASWHERNLVPEELGAAWEADFVAYFAALSDLSSRVLQALVAALGGDPGAVQRGFARPASLSTLRFNRYPESAQPVARAEDDGAELACEAHADSGLLTLLHQDARGGLQVRGRDRRWRDVEPDPDAFVVNTGLALEKMTARRFRATRHRVLHRPGARLSIPFFFEPVPGFTIDPASLGLPFPSEPDAVSYSTYLREALKRFTEYQRESPA